MNRLGLLGCGADALEADGGGVGQSLLSKRRVTREVRQHQHALGRDEAAVSAGAAPARAPPSGRSSARPAAAPRASARCALARSRVSGNSTRAGLPASTIASSEPSGRARATSSARARALLDQARAPVDARHRQRVVDHDHHVRELAVAEASAASCKYGTGERQRRQARSARSAAPAATCRVKAWRCARPRQRAREQRERRQHHARQLALAHAVQHAAGKSTPSKPSSASGASSPIRHALRAAARLR